MIIFGSEILTNLLHLIAESLLIPVVIILIGFFTFAILSLGSCVTEKFSRIRFDVDKNEKLIRAISKSKGPEEMKEHVRSSELDVKLKNILIKIINNQDIGVEARKALANKLIEDLELQYSNVTQKTDILVRLGPTMGLMGTLIPLGPGLAALGNGDISALAQALTISFDTTITGLAAGAIGFIISRYRKKWYMDDLSILESIVTSTLEALERCQERKEDF